MSCVALLALGKALGFPAALDRVAVGVSVFHCNTGAAFAYCTLFVDPYTCASAWQKYQK